MSQNLPSALCTAPGRLRFRAAEFGWRANASSINAADATKTGRRLGVGRIVLVRLHHVTIKKVRTAYLSVIAIIARR